MRVRGVSGGDGADSLVDYLSDTFGAHLRSVLPSIGAEDSVVRRRIMLADAGSHGTWMTDRVLNGRGGSVEHDVQSAVTLDDVARAAGISRATASRALTGSGPTAPETARRARAAAEQLGYEADPVARALVRGQGTRLVVAVTGTASAEVLPDAYLSTVVASAARVCADDGLGVALQLLPLDAPRKALHAMARDRSIAGVVLVNTTEQVLSAMPVGLSGRVVSIGVGSSDVPAVDVENRPVASALTNHLITSGRKRVVMLAGPSWLPCSRRLVEAYTTAMTTAGLPHRVLPGDFTATSGRNRMAKTLSRWPDTDAVYAACDDIALGALQVLREQGRQVPGDVAVAGFDDSPAAEFCGLTTATHPVGAIATAATRAALAARPVEEHLFPSEVVMRTSS